MAEAKDSKDNSGGGFKQFLWNSSTGELLGRTGSSWAKILIFYLIFYACLAAFWAVMLLIFYQTIDPHYPKWQQGESRIGVNPGLGFRPRPHEDKIESTLIWFRSDPQGRDIDHWVNNLKEFLLPYTQDTTDSAIGKGERVATADECRGNKKPEPGKFCAFNYKDMFKDKNEKCNVANSFGYDQGKPCVLIKLNRIYGWEPKPYKELPDALKKRTNLTEANGIVITCEGENPADKENIGPLRYAPSQLINANYYPYTNQPGYLSPFVMVHFMDPARGVLINVECKAWADNIQHDRQEREGSVHFELLID